MNLNDLIRCPCCDKVLDNGDTIYLRDGEIIGCELCIDFDIVHIVTDEEIEEDYLEGIYEEERINKFFNL